MISQLFAKATEKAGNQTKLAEMLGIKQGRLSEFKNYKIGDPRKPSDEMILQLAEYVGMDKAKTLYEVKLETEPQNARLWGFLVRSAGLEPTPQASETYFLLGDVYKIFCSILYSISSVLCKFERPLIKS